MDLWIISEQKIKNGNGSVQRWNFDDYNRCLSPHSHIASSKGNKDFQVLLDCTLL